MPVQNAGETERQRFVTWMRRGAPGQAPARSAPVEVKFNPWHDPENGRFTFAGTGRYFARGSGGRARAASSPKYDHLKPHHPRNHTIHVVRQGESLTQIAATRGGLRVSDLAWLNGLATSAKLRIGQRLMLPTQAYLEEGRRARATFLDLAFYMDMNGGRLPPDPTKPPSIQEQLDSSWQATIKNGYRFHTDLIKRARQIDGELRLGPTSSRSRRTQSQAGGAERRTTDDGGHYIAARFNGPRDRLNHFAQDASFNRGAYRALEDRWARHLQAGRRVHITIVPHYQGSSTRPEILTVTWSVDGETQRTQFHNKAKGK